MAMAAAEGPTTHDLRGEYPFELAYPANSLVLLAGVPGAGKSTLLSRVSAGRSVMDSARVRDRWWPVLGRIPYGAWRPLVHLVHYAQVFARLASGEALIVHDCLTRPWVRWLFGRIARGSGMQVHLVLLDVTESEALAGQRDRGRRVARASFANHYRRWRRLLPAAAQDPGSVVPGALSTVLLDRKAANRLGAIRHASGAYPRISC